MNQILLTNALSLNMVSQQLSAATIKMTKITRVAARELAQGGFTSGVGHADTAALFTEQLGLDVPANRITVSLEPGAKLLVGQYRGPRLAEGVKTLPEGAAIDWMVVRIE